MCTLLNQQQGHSLFQSSLRKSGAGMITRASVGYDGERTVGLVLRCPHSPSPPPTPEPKFNLREVQLILINRTTQPASRAIHMSQHHQDMTSNLPSQSRTQRSPYHSHHTSRTLFRSPLRFPRPRMPKQATRDNSASPCAACARHSGAPALSRKLSCVASRKNS